MPITLVTGTPGAGKSLYCVAHIIEKVAPTGRLVLHNIEGFGPDFDNVWHLDHFELDPTNWMDAPDGTLFVFDEVQRELPNRNPQSKVPPHAKHLDTHRHRGMDFMMVTQAPTMIDPHVRNLASEHFHLYRPFGLNRSTLYHWPGVNPTPNPAQTKGTAVKKNWRFPKKHFSAYRSSVQHTVKASIPWQVWAFPLAAMFLLGFGVWRFNDTFRGDEQISGTETSSIEVPENCGPLIGATPSNFLVVLHDGTRRIPRNTAAFGVGDLDRGETQIVCLDHR